MSNTPFLQPALNINLPISSLDAYISYVNQVPVLTPSEEQSLAKQLLNNNDLNAAKQLVLSHARYVVRIAKGYMGYGLSLGDLIQEGNIGLMKAIKRFDHNMGVRLITFAVHWIKSEIHEFILRNWRIVKIATTKAQRKLFFNLRRAKKRLSWFTQEEVLEVAKDLGVKPEEVREMEMRINGSDTSFDTEADQEDPDSTKALVPAIFLADNQFNPALQLEKTNWAEQSETNLHAALSQLDERSQEILAARWLDDEKMTLQELANKYGVSAERIRQLEKNAMQRLKAAIESAHL